jgi:hypothetical protein
MGLSRCKHAALAGQVQHAVPHSSGTVAASPLLPLPAHLKAVFDPQPREALGGVLGVCVCENVLVRGDAAEHVAHAVGVQQAVVVQCSMHLVAAACVVGWSGWGGATSWLCGACSMLLTPHTVRSCRREPFWPLAGPIPGSPSPPGRRPAGACLAVEVVKVDCVACRHQPGHRRAVLQVQLQRQRLDLPGGDAKFIPQVCRNVAAHKLGDQWDVVERVVLAGGRRVGGKAGVARQC